MQYEIFTFNGILFTPENLISISDPGRMLDTENIEVSLGGLESVSFFVPTRLSKLLSVNKYLGEDEFCFKSGERGRIGKNFLSKGNVRIYSWALSSTHLSKIIFLTAKHRLAHRVLARHNKAKQKLRFLIQGQ